MQAHEDTESAFAAFDITTREGLEATLRAHAAALSSLLPSVSSHPIFTEEIGRLRDLAVCSLAATGAAPATSFIRDVGALKPLAVAYVVLGSRLGARLISARLNAAQVPHDSAAHAYFRDEGSGPAWQKLQEMLAALPREETAIVADTRAAFEVFQQEAARFASRLTVKEV
ncbi:biliverdin-producing heme oxygenase [Aurantiacibacter suaedae]|uniref:biliverdin-producing heme oxygenase n=1 Tax=Aurantiacibacter suaedae TaxID=2545755 RepID=UPI0010F4A5BA|nr:biliverdin-producing heme oxygenase [Aurantiacibacter suaedae]